MSWYAYEPKSVTVFESDDVGETKVLRSDGEYFRLETKKEPIGFLLKSKKEFTQ